MDDLDRMFRRLVQNIRTGYPDYLSRPFEVSELYQNIIPYRHNRSELGLEQNQDYEMAVMRLLAGERGYLVVDDGLREQMQRELSSPNPDTSAFRSFSTAQVTLSGEAVRRLDQYLAGGARVDDARLGRTAPRAPGVVPPPPPPRAPAPPPAPAMPMPPAIAAAPTMQMGGRGAEPAVHASPPAPARAPERAAAPPPPPQAPRTEPARMADAASDRQAAAPGGAAGSGGAHSAASERSQHAAGDCHYCGGSLPAGRAVTFCPHCGQNLTVRQCPACSSELEVGWRYCITCGRSVEP